MTRTLVIDLNADLGEGIGDDIAILDVVTSANIACGFHAGDAETMARTVAAAASRGTAIGAHVAYRDREGFGRRDMDLPADELSSIVTEQITALDDICAAAGTRVSYVKPHGALYNRIVHDEEQARAALEGIAAFAKLPVLGLPGAVALKLAAEYEIAAVPEAFADRAYTVAGSLVPRSEPGAVLSDPSMVAARAAEMVLVGETAAITGERITIAAASLCVHGDTPGAVAMARAVREALTAVGVALAPFVGRA